MGIERQKREVAEAALKIRHENEADAEMKRKKEHLAKLYQAENDPKLREYLEVMQPRATTKTWANDDAVELNTEKVGHGRENNRTKARAQVVALKNRKPGGEGMMVTQTKITFEDSDDELYDNLPVVKADSKEEESGDIEMSEAPKEDNLVNDSGVSDLDWLKSRMAKPADAASAADEKVLPSSSQAFGRHCNSRKTLRFLIFLSFYLRAHRTSPETRKKAKSQMQRWHLHLSPRLPRNHQTDLSSSLPKRRKRPPRT